MRKLIFLLLLISAQLIISQNVSKKLEGYWESTTNKKDSSLTDGSEYITHQWICFTPKHRIVVNHIQHWSTAPHFTRYIFFYDPINKRHDTIIYIGTFTVDPKENIVSFTVNYMEKNTTTAIPTNTFFSRAEFVTDTNLTLLANTFHKRSTESFLSSIYREEFERVFYLENTLNSKRKLSVKSEYVSLELEETELSPGCLNRFNDIDCKFDSIAGDSVFSNMIYESISIEFKDRYSTMSNNYNYNGFNKKTKNFALKDIKYLNLKNPFRQTMHNIGGFVLSLSFVTLLSVPFAGLRLSPHSREVVREQNLITAACGFAFSIPFFILGKDKKFGISKNYKTKKTNYWVLKQKFE